MKKIFLVPVMAMALVACCGNKTQGDSCCSDSTCCADSAKCTTDSACVCPTEAAKAELSGVFNGEIAGADGALGVSLTLASGQFTLVETPQAGKGEAITTKGSYTVGGDLLTLTSESNEKRTYKVQGQDTLVQVSADGQLPEKPEMYTLRLKTN